MPTGATPDPTLTPDEEQYLLGACDAFEACWKLGERPAIEPALANAPARVQPELLRELVQLEIAYRRGLGENPDLDDYRRRFPAPTLSVPLTFAQSAAWPTVPGYQIVAELGRGGMGVVYKAVQLALKRTVALKMILNGALAGPEHRRRFQIEAEAAARFKHPNLVPIYEVGEHAGQLFFSMEFAEGGSLDKHLNGDPWEPKQAAEMARTLAGALQYAHDHMIVHRDLKPANVVLAEGRPLITDFGLAKRLDSYTDLTQTDALLGTAAYMAPEQAEAKQNRLAPLPTSTRWVRSSMSCSPATHPFMPRPCKTRSTR